MLAGHTLLGTSHRHPRDGAANGRTCADETAHAARAPRPNNCDCLDRKPDPRGQNNERVALRRGIQPAGMLRPPGVETQVLRTSEDSDPQALPQKQSCEPAGHEYTKAASKEPCCRSDTHRRAFDQPTAVTLTRRSAQVDTRFSTYSEYSTYPSSRY